MHEKTHLPVKLAAGILLNLLLCLVFFILSAIPDRGIYMASWHFALFLVWYPLSAIVYGMAAVLTALGDRMYLALMGATFLTVTIISAFVMDVVAIPAAFVYTGIMLAAAILTALVKAAVMAYLQYRNYKKGSVSDEQDIK